MQLVYTETGSPVKTGDIVQLKDGSRVTIIGFNAPSRNNLIGAVYTQTLDERRLCRERYPSAIGALFQSFNKG